MRHSCTKYRSCIVNVENQEKKCIYVEIRYVVLVGDFTPFSIEDRKLYFKVLQLLKKISKIVRLCYSRRIWVKSKDDTIVYIEFGWNGIPIASLHISEWVRTKTTLVIECELKIESTILLPILEKILTGST